MRTASAAYLLGLGLWMGLAIPLKAQAPSTATDAAETTAPAVPAGFRTYVLPEAFSLQIPSHWQQATAQPAERYAILTSAASEDAGADDNVPAEEVIRTEVRLLSEPPETAVNAAIEEIIANQYEVARYGPVTVNDLPALRLWLTDLPLAYSHQIITYIGYGSYGTAVIVSQYNSPTPETETLIQQVHDSFTPVFE